MNKSISTLAAALFVLVATPIAAGQTPFPTDSGQYLAWLNDNTGETLRIKPDETYWFEPFFHEEGLMVSRNISIGWEDVGAISRTASGRVYVSYHGTNMSGQASEWYEYFTPVPGTTDTDVIIVLVAAARERGSSRARELNMVLRDADADLAAQRTAATRSSPPMSAYDRFASIVGVGALVLAGLLIYPVLSE